MNPLLRHVSYALALTFAGAGLRAQELLAVNFQGDAYAVEILTGQSRLIGPTGVIRCNAMALHEGVLYSNAQTGSVTSGPRQLVTIDPITAHATVLWPNLGVDLRGLCENPGSNELFGIANGPTDQLVRINVDTGQVTVVGSTGLTGIQALSGNDFASFLTAWDINLGLVRVDKATGVAVDVAPHIGTQGASIQFLCSSASSGLLLIGGNSSLFSINNQTGVVTALGSTTTLADLRGAESHMGFGSRFGSGCPTATGAPNELTAKSDFLAGTTINLGSIVHAPNTIGLLVVGLSNTSYLGSPLPINLDGALGTNGCSLFVSSDLTMIGIGNTAGVISLPFPMPPVFGARLHFQSVALEAVPGGLSFSNGFTIQTPF